MSFLPPAIIFINEDLSEEIKSKVISQLYIHETMTGEEFDARVISDPNYPTVVKLQNLRILVIRSYWVPKNHELADVVIFFKAGLASIEKNNFGPPGLTLQIDYLYIHKLLRENDKIT